MRMATGSSFANRPLEQIGSLNFSLEAEKWGVRTDLSGAQGYDTASDIWGAMVMPWYNISKQVQVVTRYTPQIIPADRVSTALLTEAGDSLEVLALQGAEGILQVGQQLPLRGTLAGQALRET